MATQKKNNLTADSLGLVKMRYTIEQRMFIIEQYFKNNESLAAAVRKFHTKYGRNSVLLTSLTVKRLIEKFRETGSVGDAKHTGRKDLCLHAYKIQLTQQLKPIDHAQRREFVEWIIESSTNGC